MYEDINQEPDPLKDFICDHLKSHTYSPLAGKMKDVYQFFVWKAHHFPMNFTTVDLKIINNLELESFADLSTSSCTYTRGQMRKYSEILWQGTINSQFQSEGYNESPKVSVDKIKIPIMVDRKLETLVLSLFYPNNLLNGFLHKYDPVKYKSPLCTCGTNEQNAEHILLYCPLVDPHLRTQMSDILFSSYDHKSSLQITYPYLISWCRNKDFIKLCIKIIRSARTFLKVEIIL